MLHVIVTYLTYYCQDMPLRYGEDHAPGAECIFGQEVHKEFVVLHTNSIHRDNINSCGCSAPDTPKLDIYKQLLRAGLYPATPFEPQTCGTFAVMQQFHLLNLQGKVSAYHFYQTLQFLTDNTGTTKTPVSPQCLITTRSALTTQTRIVIGHSP